MLELIMVMVITGVVGVIALPKLSFNSQFGQRIHADNVLGLLRLGQLRAMNHPSALDATSTPAELMHRCATLALTANGLSLATTCAGTDVMSAEQLAQAASQGLYLGQRDLTLSVAPPYQLPLRLQFGEPSQSGAGGTSLLAESSWLGRPFVNGEPLSQPLIMTVAGKVLRIEPEGYIYAP